MALPRAALGGVGNGATPHHFSPCAVTVLFTKMAQHVRVTRVIVTLQVTKYSCPLNIEELEPTLRLKILKEQ